MSQPAGPLAIARPHAAEGGSEVRQWVPSEEASITSSDPFAVQPNAVKPLASDARP